RLLGLIAKAKHDPRQALVYLNKSITANGANGATWQNIGDILLDGEDFQGAITYFEQALRLAPELAKAHNALGIAWKQLGEWGKPIACFREAVRHAPSLLVAYNNLGMALRAQGQWAQAITAFEQALTLSPENADVLYNLANTWRLWGDLELAESYYR